MWVITITQTPIIIIGDLHRGLPVFVWLPLPPELLFLLSCLQGSRWEVGFHLHFL